MPVPADLHYAESHEWILTTDEGIGTVGITDHAQNELTDIVFVELPQIGAKATKGSPIAVVESVKAASDIYAPASGEIVEVNGELSSNPALVNTDPYTNGWLFKIKLSDPAELQSLKTPAEYEAQIG